MIYVGDPRAWERCGNGFAWNSRIGESMHGDFCTSSMRPGRTKIEQRLPRQILVNSGVEAHSSPPLSADRIYLSAHWTLRLHPALRRRSGTFPHRRLSPDARVRRRARLRLHSEVAYLRRCRAVDELGADGELVLGEAEGCAGVDMDVEVEGSVGVKCMCGGLERDMSMW